MIPGGHIINDGLCSPCYHCPIGRTSRPGSKKQEITVKTREVKKHVSSNQAHVVSSNQPIQKRFNVANPGLTKPGFSGDSADLLDDQRVLLSKFFVIGPKNRAIYIIYHISNEYLVAGLEQIWIIFSIQLGMSSSQLTNSYFSEG